ncbi:carboxylesterase family protein [Staphylococcus sp. 11261D007BR]
MCFVTTPLGQIQGISHDTYDVFKGIPYAKPPTHHLRFKHARPVEPWHQTFQATEWGHIPIQPPNSLETFFSTSSKVFQQDEHCLYLNIWRPHREVKGPLPVLIYLYGGGFINGHSSQDLYQPHEIVKQEDVIVVTVNYRLGALGFLDWSAINSEWDRNNGLSDQACAIKWVHQYIAHFGGDPNHLSPMGQSAGAMSIQALLQDAQIRPLIKNAILLSGVLQPDDPSCGDKKAQTFAQLKSQYFGARSFETLSSKDILFLMDKHQALYGPSKGLELLYQPILPELKYDQINIPILLGITEAEGDIYIKTEAKRLPPTQFQKVIQRAHLTVPNAHDIETAQQQRDFITTHFFKVPFQDLYRQLSAQTHVSTYTFTWAHLTHPLFASPYHILDVIFWMGRLDILEAHGIELTLEDKQLSQKMIHQLYQFVITGRFQWS